MVFVDNHFLSGFFLFFLRDANFVVPLASFGVYYFVNWLSSNESILYILGKYRLYRPNKINIQIQKKWATQKAHALFILISANAMFVIKNILPPEWKRNMIFLTEKIIYKLNEFMTPLSDLIDMLHGKYQVNAGIGLRTPDPDAIAILVAIDLLVAIYSVIRWLVKFNSLKIPFSPTSSTNSTNWRRRWRVRYIANVG